MNIVQVLNRLVYNSGWIVAYRRKDGQSDILNNTEKAFTIIKNGLFSWVADPMVVEHDGELFIFAEVYDYFHMKGAIGYTKLIDGTFSKWKIIITEKHHLSYPLIIRKDDTFYILPEQNESNKLCFYKCISFPDTWEKMSPIIDDTKFVDISLFEYDGDIYGIGQNTTNTRHSVLMHFNDALSKIEEMKDLDEQPSQLFRNAGPIFTRTDEHGVTTKIRPCQDCSISYGDGIYFRTYDDAMSRESSHVYMTSDRLHFNEAIHHCGMHHYSSTDDFEVIDVKIRFVHPIYSFMKCMYRMRRVFK